jgi:glycosyltransferase involved in cell wall biosynthesis
MNNLFHKKNSEKDLVTAGLITYNCIKTIERSINSIINQSWNNLEIIVIDDYSRDGTYEYLKNFEKNTKQLKVYQNRINSGVGFSRNKLISLSNGEFIVFFDDDDSSDLERIKYQIDRIKSYEKNFTDEILVVCHTARKVVYPNSGELVQIAMGGNLDKKIPNGIQVAKSILMGGILENGGGCPTCSQAGRKAMYEKVGGFDHSFRRLEDTDFNIRLALAGGHFIGIDYPLVTQYMTKNYKKNIDIEHFYTKVLYKKHKNFINFHNQYEFCVAWIDLRHHMLARRWNLAMYKSFKCMIINPYLFLRRLVLVLPNLKINIEFSRFHAKKTK